MPLIYDVPDASPFDGSPGLTVVLNDSFPQYVPLLLSAIDAELERRDVWPEGQEDEAIGLMEDLKAYIQENFTP